MKLRGRAAECARLGDLLSSIHRGESRSLVLRGEAGVHVGEALELVADDVESVVIPGTGHFVAEESPEEMLAAMAPFLTASVPVA